MCVQLGGIMSKLQKERKDTIGELSGFFMDCFKEVLRLHYLAAYSIQSDHSRWVSGHYLKSGNILLSNHSSQESKVT